MTIAGDPITGPSAWRRRDVDPEDYRIELSSGCLDEIRCAADELRDYPLPAIMLGADDFAMPECRDAMSRARRILDRGVRFAIVDRLPVGEIAAPTATAIYWLLSSMIARPVAQKLDGTLIYDVLDTGQQALPGSGVRPDKTNIEIRFHNDNAYNNTPPDYVGLLCLRRAMSGGHSRVISFHTARNEMSARCPERLGRLYQPFWFDRQREFHPGESPVFAAPVFDDSAELQARFSVHQINGGYALKGEPVDEAGELPCRRCSTFSRTTPCRSILTLNRARCNLSTTGCWDTAAPPLSTTPTLPRSAISCACGCATAAAAPIPVDARRRRSPATV